MIFYKINIYIKSTDHGSFDHSFYYADRSRAHVAYRVLDCLLDIMKRHSFIEDFNIEIITEEGDL